MREDDDRVSDINEGLSAVRESGTYNDLVSEYFE
jgi:ABC-type amino acid transport substrate-binding protein